jgi:tetratricopeptide (TPR) repeat protein
VDAIEEMMQLRRWEPAGMLLDRFLSTPVRSPRVWATALVRLAELLGRYHRFEDALAVQNFLIENELLDEASEYFLRLGRTMAMLREDHLVDADRAISDLRRRGPRDGGGLALVEMFRDVKTGHPDEAIEIYSKSQLALRQQLGHRVADAHALAALAFDLQGDTAGAQIAYEKAEKAIRTLRRDQTIAWILKGTLFGTAIFLTLVAPNIGVTVFLCLMGLWMGLNVYNARGTYLAVDSPSLIASGQYDEAEQEIERIIRSFWLFRSFKLMSLHHLAVLRHAQRRWRDSVLLSQALLRQRLTTMPAIARTTRLMMADSLLELGDLAGAHQALMSLYVQKLTLVEAMNLLVVQLDYESRLGAWSSMMRNISYKVQLAELMPGTSSARAQAMLALAARQTGALEWSTWLTRRVELLVDINELMAHRPILKGLWS